MLFDVVIFAFDVDFAIRDTDFLLDIYNKRHYILRPVAQNVGLPCQELSAK